MAQTYVFPSHLGHEERFLGPFTARGFGAMVVSSFIGLLIWRLSYAPPALKVGFGAILPMICLAATVVRIQGEGIYDWLRSRLTFRFGVKHYAWFARSEEEASAVSPRTISEIQDLPGIPVQILDGVVTMADYSMTTILECSGVDTSLFDDSDIDLFAGNYHRLLCSLAHPITIIKRVRPARIADAVHQRMDQCKQLTNRSLVRLELDDCAYMESLSRGANNASVTRVRTLIVVPGPKGAPVSVALRILNERSQRLIADLEQIGVHTTRLTNDEMLSAWHESLVMRAALHTQQRPPLIAQIVHPISVIQKTFHKSRLFK